MIHGGKTPPNSIFSNHQKERLIKEQKMVVDRVLFEASNLYKFEAFLTQKDVKFA